MKNYIIIIIIVIILGVGGYFVYQFLKSDIPTEETWKTHEDEVISFQYPMDYSINKTPNYFLQGTNTEGEEVIRLSYLNIQDISPPDIPGYKKMSYEDLKSAWKRMNIDFFKTQISNKSVLVSVYKMQDNKLRFGYIIQHGNYFWGLDYYEKTDNDPQHYLTNKIYPDIPKRMIESAVIKIKPRE